MVLVRQHLGDVLRDLRLQKGHTLRQVSNRASVALGYLSEVERGQKEASSEVIAAVAEALDTPVYAVMHELGDRLQLIEGIPGMDHFDRAERAVPRVPDVVPAEFLHDLNSSLLSSR